MKFSEGWLKFKDIMNSIYFAVKEIVIGPKKPNSEFPPIHRATRIGLIVLLIFFGGFALWSLLAPLESAAVAPGKIIVATNRKTIQHLEGGIVKQIYVREGDSVKAGAPLIRLEDTQAKTNYNLWHNSANELYATEARLIAERDGAASITYPEFLEKQKDDPQVQKLMKAQQEIYINDKTTLDGQLQILQQRVLQLQDQIKSTEAQVKSYDSQLDYIGRELKAVEYLEKRHLIEKTRLWSLKREEARLSGLKGDAMGSISQAQQKIGETQQQILTLKDSTLKDILKNLTDVRTKLLETIEKEAAATDILKRTLITSPQDGVVIGLQEHTVGGVITPGKPIMEIVPTQDELVIEVQINPNDIDVVHPGLVAKVQLVAYKNRNMPWLEGSVILVSPDIFQDPNTKANYYTARVVIPPKELKNLAKNVNLYPGMPVSVLIIAEKRTPFDYFVTPIKDSFSKAFREQ